MAALADAGLTAYHAVKKAAPILYPGTSAVVLGEGGRGHIGIQSQKALTTAQEIDVDRSVDALELARTCGADHTVLADGSQTARVKELTDGHGCEAANRPIRFAGGWCQPCDSGAGKEHQRAIHRVLIRFGACRWRDLRSRPDHRPGRIRKRKKAASHPTCRAAAAGPSGCGTGGRRPPPVPRLGWQGGHG